MIYTGQLTTEETTMSVIILVKYEIKAALCVCYMFEVAYNKTENMLLNINKIHYEQKKIIALNRI